MCGRYASSREPDDLVDEFDVAVSMVGAGIPADYNVAPTKEVYAVLERPPAPDRGRPAPERQLRVLTWGLVPSWAKDPKIGNRMINARAETVAEKPSFRKAFAARRCVLPADGYYEWYAGQPDERGKPRKQPFFIHPADDSEVLGMAGLYEIWRDPTKPDDAEDRFRWTCTVITTEAEDSLGRIHDRMPMLVEREHRDQWLDPRVSGNDLLGLLVPAAPGRLVAHPVSPAVGNVANNGPELTAPIPISEALVEA
ncbi:SOS response-associated peptidase [Nocardioides massiliensis]|uniref:Abasic site processing protein n=1 Tax=Nocardioides massiliensis TaxID=1325935 RepID=A0ABT9NV48_9ACTN|nr:SOS response-associated peptidase [Nocardioides massiliensis]MDP9823875.1 putative SOS response-associated peptidase YedK [Nocardioides massiliensis]